MAYSLRKSGLVDNAYFSFGEKKDADYVLEGELKEMKYTGRIWTYGLSFVGTYFWLFGAPAGTSENDMTLALKLRNTKTKKVIWENVYQKNDKIFQGYYYNWGKDLIAIPNMMQNIMNEAIPEIAKSLEKDFAKKI